MHRHMSIRNDTGGSKKEPGSQKVLDHPARMVGGGRSIDLAKLSDLSERRDAGLRQPRPSLQRRFVRALQV